MRAEPQAAPYGANPRILKLAGWIVDPVKPADFPVVSQCQFRAARWPLPSDSRKVSA